MIQAILLSIKFWNILSPITLPRGLEKRDISSWTFPAGGEEGMAARSAEESTLRRWEGGELISEAGWPPLADRRDAVRYQISILNKFKVSATNQKVPASFHDTICG